MRQLAKDELAPKLDPIVIKPIPAKKAKADILYKEVYVNSIGQKLVPGCKIISVGVAYSRMIKIRQGIFWRELWQRAPR